MKIFEIFIWIFGILAGIIIILAAISFISGAKIFGVVHVVNYFHVANTCLLIVLCCILFIQYWEKKCKKEE
ncbi:MAG: hypothetical protein AMS27_02655 [Bacteroides sp. SM23_62_1]|nr:MAG: hypothetical protein AMS27_02655 [Bacteroides sp. SM23_62_1]